MTRDEHLIFAELDRNQFAEILKMIKIHFQEVQSGRQGDDWIWVYFGEGKIEIDSFYSENLEVKGKSLLQESAKEILGLLDKNHILQIFDPPRVDLTSIGLFSRLEI